MGPDFTRPGLTIPRNYQASHRFSALFSDTDTTPGEANHRHPPALPSSKQTIVIYSHFQVSEPLPEGKKNVCSTQLREKPRPLTQVCFFLCCTDFRVSATFCFLHSSVLLSLYYKKKLRTNNPNPSMNQPRSCFLNNTHIEGEKAESMAVGAEQWSSSREAHRILPIAASASFPGFRFSPTDEELISYYLKKKTEGCKKSVEIIPEIEICRHEPWELPGGFSSFFLKFAIFPSS